MNTNDITPTRGRLKEALDNAVTNRALPQINRQIETMVNEEKIRTGRVVKFYHYLDKALVEFNDSSCSDFFFINHGFNLTIDLW